VTGWITIRRTQVSMKWKNMIKICFRISSSNLLLLEQLNKWRIPGEDVQCTREKQETSTSIWLENLLDTEHFVVQWYQDDRCFNTGIIAVVCEVVRLDIAVPWLNLGVCCGGKLFDSYNGTEYLDRLIINCSKTVLYNAINYE
jgi:hypothetical protein